MSDKHCVHGFFLAKGCDECWEFERLVESQASDNAMIRELTAKLQAAEAEVARLKDGLALALDDCSCSMELELHADLSALLGAREGE